MELPELQELLTANGVDVALYGVGEAKRLEDFLKELEAKECRLEVRNGRLTRVTSVMRMRVFADAPEGRMYLREVKQVFRDGRERCRTKKGEIYPAEKMLPGEWLHETIRRGLKEELGISQFVIIEAPRPIQTYKESMSYPGLPCHYNFPTADILIDVSEYRPEGYVEEGETLTTYFVWVPADQAPEPL